MLTCISGGRECNGCMFCMDEEKIVGKDWCGYDIYTGDTYYEIEDEIIHEDTLVEWLYSRMRTAGSDAI